MTLKKSNGRYTKEAIERALKLYASGMTAITVERLTGVKRKSVNEFARKYEVTRRFKSTTIKPAQCKQILDLYVEAKLSSTQIAEIMNINARKIRRFLMKEGKSRSRVKAQRIRWKRRQNVRNQQ